MKRLINHHHVIYDAQIIVYYCFMYNQHRIIDFTNKSRILTDFLINNDIKIMVPESVIIELKEKGFESIISEYTASKYPSQILGLPKNLSNTFKYYMQKKLENNFRKMLSSSWFEVKQYSPNSVSIDSIRSFFENIADNRILEEFLVKKGRDDPIPSDVDIEIIAFSKDMGSPVVSNDYDITFFADELFEKDLSNRLYHFTDLDFYNN